MLLRLSAHHHSRFKIQVLVPIQSEISVWNLLFPVTCSMRNYNRWVSCFHSQENMLNSWCMQWHTRSMAVAPLKQVNSLDDSFSRLIIINNINTASTHEQSATGICYPQNSRTLPHWIASRTDYQSVTTNLCRAGISSSLWYLWSRD